MIWVVVPVISVDGGMSGRCTLWTAFWIAMETTSVMPMTSSAALFGTLKSRTYESRPAATNSTNWITSKTGTTGRAWRLSQRAKYRAAMTATQNTGSASDFASSPPVPVAMAAPSVTKLPVTWAVNSPFSATKPMVST